MLRTRHFALWAACWLLTAASASAHFVWIEVAPQPDASWLIRSGFGESAGWDPDLVDNIKGTQYWIRRTSGDLAELTLTLDEKEKEMRATTREIDGTAILGACDYGVVSFGRGGPFYLRYTAKTLVGSPDKWLDTKPTPSLRAELMATANGDAVELTAFHLGKPAANVVIKGYAPNGDYVELTTDEQGRARWETKQSGMYACYCGATLPEGGEHEGKAFETQKDYTTLVFQR